MFDGLGAMMFGVPSRSFDLQLRCYSAAFFEHADSKKIDDLNHGGKILLPPSALDSLVRLNIEYPMMFKVSNLTTGRFTHCGVLEFLAEEGRCYLPSWILRQLDLNEGDCIRLAYASLPRASYAKFKPQSIDFLSISNPRAVLEVELRKFACLTKGDIIAVQYNEQLLEFLVMEVKPGTSVAIIECDMNVEFDAPEGYVEPQASYAGSSGPSVKPSAPPMPAVAKEGMTTAGGFVPFSGSGFRLDGKSKSSHASLTELESAERTLPPVVVDPNYVPGHLSFVRYDYKNRSVLEKEMNDAKNAKGAKTTPFEGAGKTIRDRDRH